MKSSFDFISRRSPGAIAAAVLALAGSPTPPGFAQVSSAGPAAELDAKERAVVERSRAWIEEGWSPGAETERFSFDSNLKRFYDPTPGALVLHDTNDPEMRIMHDARRYGDAFAPFVASQAFLDNEWTGLEHVRVEGDMAIVAFTADAVFHDASGAERRTPHFYSLGWRRMEDGEWRIFHEHGSSLARKGSE